MYPNPTWEIDSRSNFLISSLLALIFPPQTLLLSFLPEPSSTWFSAKKKEKCLHENIEKFIQYIEQMEYIIPFITCEIALCQYLSELVPGINIFDSNFGVKIDSVKQPIQSNSVGS